MDVAVFATGLTMGLSLIVAIGAQNVFVLRQGLRHEHVFAVCLACALSDAALVVLGVTSFGKIAAILPWVDQAMRLGGAAFLIWYGGKACVPPFARPGHWLSITPRGRAVSNGSCRLAWRSPG